MANWSASENGDTCVDLAYARKDSDVNSIEEDDLKIETDRMQFKGSTKKECLVANLVGVKYGVEDGTEDADDVNDAGDTSSSFSLEECMNEFRARRIRRTSLTHHRQEADKEISCGNNVQGTTELDLINQNLCNKEHERKCKPCRNGFCYCFTSDSGDGGGNFGDCHKIGSLHNRNFRRNRRSECIQILNSEKRSSNSPRSKEVSKQHIPQESVGKATSLKKTKKTAHRLKAISSLETSTVDGPLIQIVQELHENCVVSKVKINKHKMQKFKDKTCAIAKTAHTIHKKAYFNDAANARKHNVSEKYTPTAPILDNIDVETNVSKTVKNIKNDQDCSGRRHNSGGQLLQKRLSISKMRYNPKDIKKPPPKPPRSSLCNEYKYCESATSISSSVRDAERVVDDFLAKKGVIVNAGTTTNNGVNLIKISKKPKNEKKFESIISKSDPLSHQKEPKEEDKNVISTYPSLSGLERAIDLKNVTLYDTNVRHAMDDATKVMRAGWNESKITSMLNYDAYKNQGKFVSMSSEAQPQQDPSTFIVENEKTIGWQMPPKITLDAVDGIVHHNLASNFEDKNTPVKKKISPSQNSKNGSGTQKFIWSEQLRNLSPWSNKYNINDTNNSKHKLPSSSKGFVISSKKKLLRLISPKKGNKDRNCLQKSNTPYRNVGVQTIYNNVSRKQANGHSQCELCSSPQSPPGSYHSPMQSSNIQYPFLTNSQNTIANETEPALFDFSRTVHSPPKKSNRKLNFPLNCTFMCKKGSSKNIDICNSSEGCNHMKTYRSFNSEVNQDASILKINHILSNIRAKLEANDDEAARKFLETVSIVDHDSSNFDWSDSHHKKRIGEHLELHNHSQPSKTTENYFNDPIYSEIEDDSFLVSQSPEFGNRTAIQHLIAAHNPDIVYAKVNKGDKPDRDRIEEQNAQLPLAKIMKDSLKNKKVITKFIPLPTLSEPPGNESTSYSMPLSSSLLLSHCQSLNNVRVLEHNLLPKKQRNLSKSDLSLHLSNIFLENLCKSELLVNAGFEEKNYEKLENVCITLPHVLSNYSSLKLFE